MLCKSVLSISVSLRCNSQRVLPLIYTCACKGVSVQYLIGISNKGCKDGYENTDPCRVSLGKHFYTVLFGNPHDFFTIVRSLGMKTRHLLVLINKCTVHVQAYHTYDTCAVDCRTS